MLVCAIPAMISFYCDMVLAFNLKKEDLAILNKLQQEIFKIFSKNEEWEKEEIKAEIICDALYPYYLICSNGKIIKICYYDSSLIRRGFFSKRFKILKFNKNKFKPLKEYILNNKVKVLEMVERALQEKDMKRLEELEHKKKLIKFLSE